MPILAYFAIMTPTLLGALLLVSTYLEPNQDLKLLGINSAQAGMDVRAQDKQEAEFFERLRALPINNAP